MLGVIEVICLQVDLNGLIFLVSVFNGLQVGEVLYGVRSDLGHYYIKTIFKLNRLLN